MSILIGIKNEHASGSYNGTEGFQGFSIDANSIHILKEGSKEELREYVKTTKAEGEEAAKVIEEMEDEYGQYTNLTSDQWDRLYDQMLDKMPLRGFSKLLILEGELI